MTSRAFPPSLGPSSPSFLLFIAVILHGRADEKAIILTSARPSVRPLPHSLSQTLWSTKKLFLFSPWIWIPLLRSSRIGLLGVHVEFGRDQVGKGGGSRGAGEKNEVKEGRKEGRLEGGGRIEIRDRERRESRISPSRTDSDRPTS